MSVLGTVKEIRDYNLVVALPHGIDGHVGLEDMSVHLVRFLRSKAKGGDDDSDGASDAEDDAPDFHSIFVLGEQLLCRVSQLEEGANKSRIVRLSLKPQKVNEGLQRDALAKGLLLAACVISAEEHGYTLDLGVGNLKGFLRKRQAQAYLAARRATAVADIAADAADEAVSGATTRSADGDEDGDEAMDEADVLFPGQPLTVVLLAAPGGAGRAVKVSVSQDHVTSALQQSADLAMEALLAGQLVRAKVASHAPNGLELSFLGFTGTVHWKHLPERTQTPEQLAALYQGKVLARIILTDPASKTMTLSLLPGHVALRRLPVAPAAAAGARVEECTVERLDATHGLVMRLPGGALGFAHISHIGDGDLDRVPKKKYAPGSTHAARVLGMAAMDGLTSLSLQPAVLEAQFLHANEVQPGEIVSGTVLSLADYGMLVQLAKGVRGLVQPHHYADAMLKHPEKKFGTGDKVRCLVLRNSVDEAGRHRLVLSLKKSLLRPAAPLLTSYEDAVAGTACVGFVRRVFDYGCVVEFLNGVCGLVARGQLSATQHIEDATTFFREGQVVRCHVLTDRAEPGKLQLSLRTDAESVEQRTARLAQADALTTGTRIQATVERVVPGEGLHLSLVDFPAVRAVLALEHLSDHASLCEGLLATYHAGEVVSPLIVAMEHARPLLSLKPRLLAAAAAEAEASTSDSASTSAARSLEALAVGAVYPGYIRSTTKYGCFVGLLHGLAGLCDLRHMDDRFVDAPERYYQPGQTVLAKVLEVDAKAGRVRFALAATALGKAALPARELLSEYFADVSRLANAARTLPAVTSTTDAADSGKTKKKAAAQALAARTTAAEAANAAAAYVVGQLAEARVIAQKKIGVLVEVRPSGSTAAAAGDRPCAGFVPKDQALGVPSTPGDDVPARVLDVDVARGVLDLTLRSELVQVQSLTTKAGKSPKGKSPKGKAAKHVPAAPAVGSSCEATVELVKEDYMVVSLAGGALAFAATKSYNDQLEPVAAYAPGKQGRATVVGATADGRTLVAFALPGGTHAGKAEAKVAGTRATATEVRESVQDLAAGHVLEAAVKGVVGQQINLDLGRKLAGRVHVTEVLDADAKPAKGAASVLAAFSKGQRIRVKVIGFHHAKTHQWLPLSHPKLTNTVVDCTLRSADLATGEDVAPAARPTLETVRVGQRLPVFVQRVTPAGVWVSVSACLDGRVPLVMAGGSVEALATVAERLTENRRVSAWVLAVDRAHSRLELSLVKPSTRRLAVGQVMPGRVLKVAAWGALVEVAPNVVGRIAITDMADRFTATPMEGVVRGAYVNVAVVGVTPPAATAVTANEQDEHGDHGVHAALSLRPSRVTVSGTAAAASVTATVADPEVDTEADLQVGGIYRGYITAVKDAGVYVALGRNITARVLIANLSDLFVRDYKRAFRVGMLVRGRVLGKSGPGKVDLSLRMSHVDPAAKPPLTLADMTVGDIVTGVVQRVEPFGLFVAIDNSALSGMVHVSECADSFVKDIKTLYSTGDTVKAKVTVVDSDKKRIRLGLKPSYFKNLKAADKVVAEADAPPSADRVSDPVTCLLADGTVDTTALAKRVRSEDVSATLSHAPGVVAMQDVVEHEDSDEDSDEEDSDDDEKAAGEADAAEASSDEEEEDSDADDGNANTGSAAVSVTESGKSAAPEAKKAKRTAPALHDASDLAQQATNGTAPHTTTPRLQVDASSLLWGRDAHAVPLGTQGLGGSPSDAEDSDGDSSSDDEGETQQRAPRSKKAKLAVAREEEARLRKAEASKLAADADVPQTAEDFDRLVMAEPNNSYVWVQYIAFYLQVRRKGRGQRQRERDEGGIGEENGRQ